MPKDKKSKESALFYRLDKSDTIIEAGGTWNDMASQNGATELTAGNVLGTRLYDHVSGEATRMFVWTLFDAVRILRRPATRDYRCDSPDCRRYMKMVIKPQDGGQLQLDHTVVRVEPFAKPLLFTAAERGEIPSQARVLIRCSSCNNLRTGGYWHEPDTIDTAPFQNGDGSISVVYGVCDRCQSIARMPPVNRRNLTP